ncbi:MAG: ECF-type sigma factor [Thermoanaerobaculia bacterium]
MADHEIGELLARCARSFEPDPWREFVRRFEDRLTRGIDRAVRRFGVRLSREEREDLVQDAYYRLLDKQALGLRRCRARRETEIGAYLGRIGERVVVDHLRASSALKRGRRHLVDRLMILEGDPADGAVDQRPSPEEWVLNRERRRFFLERCRDVVGKRSVRDLNVLYLAFFEGHSSREICRQLGGGLTPSCVDSMVHRLKHRLAAFGLQLPRR